MIFLSKSGLSLNVINIAWVMSMRSYFSSKFSNFGIIFAAWHGPNDMPTSLATSLIVIRRLTKIIFFIASMFSSVVDVLGRLGLASSLTSSWSSLNRLYHNWTYVLLLVDLPKATVNISSGLAHLIPFFTQNLIRVQFLWSISSNSKKPKSTPKHD